MSASVLDRSVYDDSSVGNNTVEQRFLGPSIINGPPPNLNGSSGDLPSNGKRFIRRAKRWAALQQKKQTLQIGGQDVVQEDIQNSSTTKIDANLVDSVTGTPLITYRLDGRPLPPPILTTQSAALLAPVSAPPHNHHHHLPSINHHPPHPPHVQCFCCNNSGGHQQLASMGVGLIAVQRHQQQQQLAAAASFSALSDRFYSAYSSANTNNSEFLPFSPSDGDLRRIRSINMESAPAVVMPNRHPMPMTRASSNSPDSSCSGVSELASAMSDLSTDSNNCGLQWNIGRGHDEVDCCSVCSTSEPTNNFSITESLHTRPPPQRDFIYFRRIDRDRPIALVSVMCYNVLCDKYATSMLYSYCPSWALNWEYRKNSIMKEIKSYDSDIITLQEVETEQYRLLFEPELEQLGYKGIFSPKSRAKTMPEEEKKYVDGCAVFWKADKFELVQKKLIEFTSIAIKSAEGSEDMINRVMTRDNIGLCAVLKVKQAIYPNTVVPPTPQENVIGNPLVVCTAHVHWDPEFCDVKLVQTMMLVHELAKIIDHVGNECRIDPQHIPTLLCGDLNSLPDSGVFEFLTKSAISMEHQDLKEFRRSGKQCLQSFSSGTSSSQYTHALKLDSAYDTAILPFTNFTFDFKGMIDYVFASPALFRVGVLGPLDAEWLQTNKILGFPHPHLPSDHIPLLAHYAIVPPAHMQSFRQQQQQSVNNQSIMQHSAFGSGHMHNGTAGFGFGAGAR